MILPCCNWQQLVTVSLFVILKPFLACCSPVCCHLMCNLTLQPWASFTDVPGWGVFFVCSWWSSCQKRLNFVDRSNQTGWQTSLLLWINIALLSVHKAHNFSAALKALRWRSFCDVLISSWMLHINFQQWVLCPLAWKDWKSMTYMAQADQSY